MDFAAIVFLASAAFILYVLFGYPLLLAWLARKPGKPVRKAPARKTVSVILPVYNGERWIREKLDSILALHYPRHLVEILVFSDGSTDSTELLAREFENDGVRVFALPRGGKAKALNAGLEKANGEILFFTDVRQQLSPNSLRDLVDCFSDATVGAVSGELVILNSDHHEEKNVGLYWKYEKWIRSRLSRIDSTLGASGCIYAMRRELAVPLPADTLLDDVYLPLAAFFSGFRVVLEDRAKAYDYPTSLQTEFNRKVRTLAGVYQIMRYYPALLGPGNRMWIHFVSHKLGRLLLPHALLAVAVTSIWLPEPWNYAMLAAQAAFYGLAALDPILPETLKRLSSPVRTFVVLMAASFRAASILLQPNQNLWKETRVSTGESSPACRISTPSC